MPPTVISVSLSPAHTFSKKVVDQVTLLEGLGIEGDAHCGKTVRHRSRLKIRPIPPNLRQVHLIQSELFDELKSKGFHITPGLIGENITTRGIDLLSLPRGSKLFLGKEAVVEITGLRNPCQQLNDLQPGLLSAVVDHNEAGKLIRKAGIMGIVRSGGIVMPGDEIHCEYPDRPYLPLERV